MVLASHILHLPVGIPAAEVAREIHGNGLAIGLQWQERTVREHLCRQLWLLPVAAPHLYACKAQFSYCTTGYKLASVVDKEVIAILERPTDGDIVKSPAGFYLVARRVTSTLCGTIAVDNRNMITIHRRELLAACRDKPLRQIVICIQQ
jgi:hypothetical protein